MTRADDVDGTIIGGGVFTRSNSVESNNEVKMNEQNIIDMIERAGFDGERDTVYDLRAAVYLCSPNPALS